VIGLHSDAVIFNPLIGDQMNEKSKITAAISAVMSYLEEEAAAMQAAPQDYNQMAQPPMPPARFWGVSGRQAQMQMRSMMQLKAFHRLR
jgi:hypothetical protein